jgi:hypothetical protein
MWTAEHRRAADRKGLGYPSDTRDAEWALIASLIRAAKRGGRKRSVSVREVLNGFFSTRSRRAANGRRCRRICRRKALRIPISCCGIGTAQWSASITRSISRPASVKDARRARRLRSSPARAPRPLNSPLTKSSLVDSVCSRGTDRGLWGWRWGVRAIGKAI